MSHRQGSFWDARVVLRIVAILVHGILLMLITMLLAAWTHGGSNGDANCILVNTNNCILANTGNILLVQ